MHYVYYTKENSARWKPREQGCSIGRMYSANPFIRERDYLRLLETIVCGALSFDYLRTVDGVVHPTLKAACVALRLLEDDGEWVALFNDGREFVTGRELRHLFALALQDMTNHQPTLYLAGVWREFL